MKVVADLHLHSKYSRAVSQQMVLPEMVKWAKRKGINLLGTGDFTHPLWFRELRSQLQEDGKGIYKLKSEIQNSNSEANSNFQKEPLFLLSTEISSIYSQGGKLRRIHNVVLAPSLETVEKINDELLKRGTNLMSDGRPITGLSAKDLAEIILTVDKDCMIIPAHIWTPWFSLYGSESGFDSIEECFGNLAKYIYAVETGLSSNPEMNWRIVELDGRQIVSSSDAHSGAKLGREATVIELPEVSYGMVRKALILEHPENSGNQRTGESENQKFQQSDAQNNQLAEFSEPRIACTIEFYPEEGKYHYTGHRNCKVRQSPEETNKLGSTCPVCGKGLTVGVMHRVEDLASRNSCEQVIRDNFGIRWIKNSQRPERPRYVMLVPLLEIIAESFEYLPSSQKVINEYNNLTDRLGSELKVLLKTPIADIIKISGDKVADGVRKVREGQITVSPGYDGEFGKVKIWSEDKIQEANEEKKDQLSFF